MTDYASKHINIAMSDVITINGAIDRVDPDPSSPLDPMSVWIGTVAVTLEGRTQKAAVLRIATGGGANHMLWGQYVLSLRWIGDPPDPEIARAVYDIIQDGGPKPRQIRGTWRSQPMTEAQPSYRTARA